MKTAVVTGASSGIGLEITHYLLKDGWQVAGISRDFSKSELTHKNFCPYPCDITDTKSLAAVMDEIISYHKNDIHLLVNNAGFAQFAPLEELSTSDIIRMADTNFRAPILISSLLLRELKKTSGKIIHILSATARDVSPVGNVYAGTKAGLLHFSRNLSDEVRKSGVQIVSILPDITATPFYGNKTFEPDQNVADSFLEPTDVVSAIDYVLRQREGVSVTEISLRPKIFRISRKGK